MIAAAALGLPIAAGSTASAKEPETARPIPASAADVRPLLIGASGQDHPLLRVPAVFIPGADGKVTFVYANPDYKTR